MVIDDCDGRALEPGVCVGAVELRWGIMIKPIVVHINKSFGTYKIKVDRGTDWGNPFVMQHEQDRDRVCDLFILYANWRLTVEPMWLVPLRGHNLACWCAPKRCHADTLLCLANL